MNDADYPELGVVRIATRCPQKWSQMVGDDSARHCGRCDLMVFNFSKLTSEEARVLLRKNAEGGRICARIYRRLDGTVMTSDCRKGFGYGWQTARTLLPSFAFVALPLLALIIGLVTLFGDNIRRLQAMSGQITLAGDVTRTR